MYSPPNKVYLLICPLFIVVVIIVVVIVVVVVVCFSFIGSRSM